MKILVTGAATALFLALGQSAFAAEASTNPNNYAALTCRAASGTLLACEPVKYTLNLKTNDAASPQQRASQGGPDFSRALSPMQINDAWKSYVDRTFSVDHSG